jgi:ferredoxin
MGQDAISKEVTFARAPLYEAEPVGQTRHAQVFGAEGPWINDGQIGLLVSSGDPDEIIPSAEEAGSGDFGVAINVNPQGCDQLSPEGTAARLMVERIEAAADTPTGKALYRIMCIGAGKCAGQCPFTAIPESTNMPEDLQKLLH